jgi:LysM repeat protein
MNFVNTLFRFLVPLTAFCFVGLTAQGSALTDSLRMEYREAESFVIHQVEPKETLYSLSRRYGVTLADIIKYNPGAQDGLDIGQVLSIPYSKENVKVTHVVGEGETLYAISRKYNVDIEKIREWNNLNTNDLKLGQLLNIYPATESEQPKVQPIEGKTHLVSAGETLFAISKKYDVSIRKLRKWNELEGNEISIGQQLVISKDGINKDDEQATVATDAPTEENSSEPSLAQPKNPVVDTIYVNYRKPEKKIDNASGFESIVEEGIAEVIENNSDTRKYLALHREAPVGTLMQVRNEDTGLRVFVRVIGRLPDTGGNEALLIKISKPAYQRLGATNKRFRVVTSYVP